MFIKTTSTLIVPPALFLTMAALPAGQWEFAKSSAMGAFIGTATRLCMAMYRGEIKTKKGALGLIMASFFFGLAGGYLFYLFGFIDGTDPVKITAAAVFASLFAILLEELFRQHIKLRAGALSNGVPNSAVVGSPDDITARGVELFGDLASTKKTSPDEDKG